MIKQMRFVAVVAFSTGSIFSGCQTAHDVAVTSFRVLDAPAAYIRRHVDGSDTTTTTTTTTAAADSDVVAPGRVIGSAPQTAQDKTSRRSSTSNTETVQAKPKSSPAHSPHAIASQTVSELPIAKPVPGKPGYVLSPFDPNGGYVDVTGYKPGDKVKDPYSKKIFLVP